MGIIEAIHLRIQAFLVSCLSLAAENRACDISPLDLAAESPELEEPRPGILIPREENVLSYGDVLELVSQCYCFRLGL